MQTFGFLMSGRPGSGKSVMAMSYHKKNKPQAKRLVIDKEARALSYNSQEHGVEGDHWDKLLFDFTLFPDQYGEMALTDFLELIKILKGKDKPDVFIVENMAMLQSDIEAWTSSAGDSAKIVEALGIKPKYKNFLETRFKFDPSWRSMQKDILKNLILTARRNNIDIVLTTEMRNEWENYGSREKDAQGNPKQKIIGQTAKIWDTALMMVDTCWQLKRNAGKISDKPTVTIDPINPKLSIVGVPPIFTFEGWDQIWNYEASRGVTTAKQFEAVAIPEPQYGEPEEGVDSMETGKNLLIEEVKAYYPDRDAVRKALVKLGLTYTLDKHEDIRTKLVEAKNGQKV